MKAIVYREYGAPDVLQLVEVEKPTPRENEVCIRVCATSVTAADTMMRRGNTLLSRMVLGLTKPAKRFQILGTELAGIIESTGRDVTRFKKGDQVYGFRGFGTGV